MLWSIAVVVPVGPDFPVVVVVNGVLARWPWPWVQEFPFFGVSATNSSSIRFSKTVSVDSHGLSLSSWGLLLLFVSVSVLEHNERLPHLSWKRQRDSNPKNRCRHYRPHFLFHFLSSRQVWGSKLGGVSNADLRFHWCLPRWVAECCGDGAGVGARVSSHNTDCHRAHAQSRSRTRNPRHSQGNSPRSPCSPHRRVMAVVASSTYAVAGIPPLRRLPPQPLDVGVGARRGVAAGPGCGVRLFVAGARRADVLGAKSD